MRVELRPHQCDPELRQVFLRIHPVRGTLNTRIGYACPAKREYGLLPNHGLHSTHIAEIDKQIARLFDNEGFDVRRD